MKTTSTCREVSGSGLFSPNSPLPETSPLLGGAVAAPLLAAGTSAVPLLLGAMALASLSAATGQGVPALRATGVVPACHKAGALGLSNLAYLLSVAFGPAIALTLAQPTG
ncbi:hypothetical protein ACFHW0_20695 [Micromonospora sp. LOL_025]|uniref:hypothetical protein n=1 Tax=Micromonospora sp. LOL_025 TaxID=3345413 RepID=UPI003A8A6211